MKSNSVKVVLTDVYRHKTRCKSAPSFNFRSLQQLEEVNENEEKKVNYSIEELHELITDRITEESKPLIDRLLKTFLDDIENDAYVNFKINKHQHKLFNLLFQFLISFCPRESKISRQLCKFSNFYPGRPEKSLNTKNTSTKCWISVPSLQDFKNHLKHSPPQTSLNTIFPCLAT